jgi:hypothetical protein
MREQAQRQQQSDQRLRAQQNERLNLDPGGRRVVPGGMREP